VWDLDAKVLDDQAAFIGNERLSEVNQNNLSEKMQTQGIGYGHSSDVVLMDRILQGIRRKMRYRLHGFYEESQKRCENLLVLDQDTYL